MKIHIQFEKLRFFMAFNSLLHWNYEALVWKISLFTQSLDLLKYPFQRDDAGNIAELVSLFIG
jgi:hypothetical protein